MPDDLGDFFAELKLSFFQLGISPQIIASIIMQVCNFSLAIWWISLGFAIVEAVIVACYSLQYSIYAASYKYFGPSM
ncbi:preprotein translocase subunit SCY2, chloroplastic isoform X4 [Gossypium hirsutum]|uniref:Preprotein translocase subunit SCY2, chloroplastic isoform X4 n=1 Tax=Gossypium hirsutum TaxID=3635 RepID=A0A1U8PKJ7_GOSHI|nr:preprotein translocase subunit SCY2, chloroplastic isoform X4 [Gossypium hirsutum]